MTIRSIGYGTEKESNREKGAGTNLAHPPGEPKVHPGLMGLSNVVLAPHIASASSDTRIKMAALAVDNCLAVLEGQTPPTPVNPEVLGKR